MSRRYPAAAVAASGRTRDRLAGDYGSGTAGRTDGTPSAVVEGVMVDAPLESPLAAIRASSRSIAAVLDGGVDTDFRMSTDPHTHIPAAITATA